MVGTALYEYLWAALTLQTRSSGKATAGLVYLEIIRSMPSLDPCVLFLRFSALVLHWHLSGKITSSYSDELAKQDIVSC